MVISLIAKRKIIPIFVPHLGCPNDCVFCNQRKISGSLIPATPESVAAELEAAKQRVQGDAELAFYGGSFTAIEPSVQRGLLEAAKAFDYIKSIRVSTRPDKIDEAALDLLRQYGVETVEIGMQSMDERVLRLSGRGHTAAHNADAAALVKRAGFTLIAQMMTGLPGSSPQSDIATANAVAKLKPDGVRIYPTVIIRDTHLYELWQKGLYKEHTVDEAVDLCRDIVDIFDESKINIIRLGLNPSDDLSGGEAVAGAYHPAFGELVYSARYLRRAEQLLNAAMPAKIVEIYVNGSELSKMIGQGRRNVNTLISRFELKKLSVKSRDIPPGDIEILVIS